jgi:hypothetical protein
MSAVMWRSAARRGYARGAIHGLDHQEVCGAGLNGARSRPDGSMRVAIVLSLLVVVAASAQAIQQWKTPDGSLFFGDRPPAGSTKVGEVGSDSQPPEPVLSSKEFTAKATRSRSELDLALRRNSDRLWDIRDQLDKIERLKPKDDPEFVMSGQQPTDVAAFQARKAEMLRRLREAERKSWSAIANLWKSLDELSSEVASRYGGKSPDWWQDKIDCPNCATREDAEGALKQGRGPAPAQSTP